MHWSGIIVRPSGSRRVRPISKAWLVFFALSLKRSGDGARQAASGGRLDIASVAGTVGCRIRCAIGAPRVWPLTPAQAGAETALFHYHRYFSGSQCPDGEAI